MNRHRHARAIGTAIAVRAVALAAVAALVVGVAGTASAEKKAKSVQTEARWVAFDSTAKTVTVRIRKPGRGNKDKTLRSGKEAVFNVKPEGSVLTRTTVAINGRRGEITDIPVGKTVNIYWVPGEKEGERFARKIDVILSEEELEERYRAADED